MSTDGMSNDNRSTSHAMLRWYPARWRSRYGDEFAVMIEDDLGGRAPTIRYRLSVVRCGLIERLRGAGLVGNSVSPSEQVRSGALTVLCAFALFFISVVAFAKISEHWDQSIQGGSRHVPAVSFNLLASLACVCALALVAAIAVLFPAFVRFLRAGGWHQIKRRVEWAVISTAVTVAIVLVLAMWAGHLTYYQRNVGFGWYQFVFMICAIAFAIAIAAWTAAAVATTRRLNIGKSQLKMAAVLAILVAVCMPVMTVAASVWWGSMATIAPWFLAGTPAGSSSSPLATNLLVDLILMMVASVVGVIGLLRVSGTWRELKSS